MANTFWKTMLDASMVGINMVVATFIGLAIGYFLDRLLGTGPWLTVVFLLFGIATGFFELYKFTQKKMNGGDGKKDI